MPFGFKTAPAVFQRLMHRILGEMLFEECIVYLDDIVIWGATRDEVAAKVKEIARRMTEAGLKLNGEKSVLLTKKIEVLGHDIVEGVMTP